MDSHGNGYTEQPGHRIVQIKRRKPDNDGEHGAGAELHRTLDDTADTLPAHLSPKRLLYNALINVLTSGWQLDAVLRDVGKQWEHDPHGPEDLDLPTPTARERRAKMEAKTRGTKGAVGAESRWVPLLDSLSNVYQMFNNQIDNALSLVEGVADSMNDPKEPAPKHWTFRVRAELARVMNCWPTNKWGRDGHRFWTQPPDDAKTFLDTLETVRQSAHDLWCAGAAAEGEPEPTSTSPKLAKPSDTGRKKEPAVAPVLRRPVPVSGAAAAMNKRASSVKRKLINSNRSVDKTQKPAVAELDHICQCFPRFKKRLIEWADKHYPAAE